MNVELLQRKSKDLRLKVLDIVHQTKKGHIGSSFSVIDILVTLYYTDLFDVHKDMLLMGKGHACLPVYCIFNDLGIIDDSHLAEFGTNGGRLGAQFDREVPTIEYNTGSLGNVFGIAVGLAVAGKYRNTYAIVGDAECEEGATWETADFVSRLSNCPMILIVDKNQLGIIHKTENDNLGKKFEAFGMSYVKVDGHNHHEVYTMMKMALSFESPWALIMNTTKGKGVSFMENDVKWHTGVMTQEQYEQARMELQNGH